MTLTATDMVNGIGWSPLYATPGTIQPILWPSPITNAGKSKSRLTKPTLTKPFGFMAFSPGPGVGGHCIPVDPYYLSWKAREFDFYTKFIELAAEVNADMPNHVVGKIAAGLNLHGKALRGSRVLVLGVAFKRDIDDARGVSL